MSVNVNALPVVTELNTTDRIPAVISASNEGRAITLANLGRQAAEYTTAKNRGTIATGTNLNTVTDAGTYVLNGNNTYTNGPAGVTFGLLEVLTTGTTTVIQRLTTSAGVTWTRFTGGTWSEWFQTQRSVRPGEGYKLINNGRTILPATIQDSSKGILISVPSNRLLSAVSTFTVTALSGLRLMTYNGDNVYYGSTAFSSMSLANLPSGVTVSVDKAGQGFFNISLQGENAFVTEAGGSTAIKNFSPINAMITTLSILCEA